MVTASRLAAELRPAVRGRVIGPDDQGYDEARLVAIGGVDRRPAAIVRAADAEDVARAVLLSRDAGVPLAVRAGGHSAAGHGVCDDGIVIDLREMKGLRFDAESRTGLAEGGVTAGEYTAAAGALSLATGFGDTGSVGVAGLTLGGGIGYLVRKHGMTIDNLLSADVVTADGSLVHADERNHPDLFWAIRGGGGNFGVATRLELRMHDVSSFVGGMLVLPADAGVIAGFIAAAQAAPDGLSTIANVMPAPPMPFLPREHHGRLVILAMVAWTGDVEEGSRVIAPLRALARPLADMVRPTAYPQMFPSESGDYRPLAAMRTLFLDAVDAAAAREIVERLSASDAPMRVAQLRVLGGAMARVPAEATAFAHRSSRIMGNIATFYTAPEEKAVREGWVLDLVERLRGSDDGAYVNFLGDEGAGRVRAAYPAGTWQRLAAVKRRYDPTNLFRLNQNIPPAGPEA